MTISQLVSTPFKPTSLLTVYQKELEQRLSWSKLLRYRPYTKQKAFHSQLVRERLLMAGNQLGKTVAGAYEMAMHLTGQYPEWWEGRRFTKPIAAWAGSVSTLATRDTVQRLVCGRPGKLGTGSVPKASIVDSKSAMIRCPGAGSGFTRPELKQGLAEPLVAIHRSRHKLPPWRSARPPGRPAGRRQ